MSQHEYIFVAVSIILGLAITRLLHSVGELIRAYKSVTFHWSTALWGISIMTFNLQFWWAGWGLRDFEAWSFTDFMVLIFGSICVYGASEMALPDPNDGQFDMLQHSEHLGRLSALSMLAYFLIGPYVNIFMYHNAVLPSLALPSVGLLLMVLVIAKPRWFGWLSALFFSYALLILYVTA